MTEERYNEIESILNSIKYDKIASSHGGITFMLSGKYSDTVSITKDEVVYFFRKKYSHAIDSAVIILYDRLLHTIVLYDSNMNETKMNIPFESFCYYDDDLRRVFGYDHLLPYQSGWSSISNPLTVCITIEPNLTLGHLSIQNAKIKPASAPIYDVYISFEFTSRSLRKVYTFDSRPYRSLLNDSGSSFINIKDVLSPADFQKYEEQMAEMHKSRMQNLIEEWYSASPEALEYYRNLSDSDRLKLELTGEL